MKRLLILTCLGMGFAVPVEAAQPNFVVIFSDDQGYADVGCFGSPDIRTPRLDAMATEGMKFTSFYAQPVCGPSRAALMTGCYPMRVAERGNEKQVHPILHSDEITVAEVLKTKGYTTACFGKWDLAKHAQEGFFMDLFPTHQGFDYFFGTPTSNDRVATRNENIRWRTPMPEAGMSGVTIVDDRVFVTTHVPIKSETEQNSVTDIIGFCLDANTGEILWQVTLPGTAFISLAGGFTDGTVFAPIADAEHVWFFNRCGSMGCYDMSGREVWLREWTPRFKHNNRQAEPYLIGNTILYVEVANKEHGAKIRKWAAPGKKSKGTGVPEGVNATEVWTYIHGIDKRTGKVLWREQAGTVVHNTPVVGMTADGRPAVSHSRGGPHQPFEKPAGLSLTSLASGEEGRTLWSTELKGYDPSFASHWNAKYVFGFQSGNHVVLDATSGKLLRKQPLYSGATVWKFTADNGKWSKQTNVAVKAGKGHPNTNQANIVIGDWHWFLSHNVHYLGRVHVETGNVEYLELPAQLMPSTRSREQDVRLWGKGNARNRPLNAAGFAVGDKGNSGTGWGHISAASPTLVGQYLFLPVVTGTVYVIDTRVKELSPEAMGYEGEQLRKPE